MLKTDETGDISAEEHEGIEVSLPIGNGHKGKNGGLPDIGTEPGQTLLENEKASGKANPISRSAHRGPKIAFVNAPDRLDLAWVEGNTISINTGHPVHKKMKSDYKEKRVLYLVAIGCAIKRSLTLSKMSKQIYFL